MKRLLFTFALFANITPHIASADALWRHERHTDENGDKICLLRHSDNLAFRIRKSVDRLEVAFFNLPQSALDDAKSPFLSVNMRVDRTYLYSGQGEIFDGGAASPTISVMTSTIDDNFVDALEAGTHLYLNVSESDQFDSDLKTYDKRYNLQGSRAAFTKLYECRAMIMK